MLKRGKTNKKGISPLIATVLIVGFVIVLAGLVYVFMGNTINEQISKQGAEAEGAKKCLTIQVSVADIKCSSPGTVKFKNTGSQGVAGFTFRIGSTVKTKQEPLDAGKDRTYTVGTMTAAQENSAIPMVAAKGYAYNCKDKVITLSC